MNYRNLWTKWENEEKRRKAGRSVGADKMEKIKNEEKDEFEIKTIKEEDLKKVDKQIKQEEKSERSDITYAGAAIYEGLLDIKSTLNSANYSLVNIGRAADSAVVELEHIDRKFKDLNSILRDIRDELHISNMLVCKDSMTLRDQAIHVKLLKELEDKIMQERKDLKNKPKGMDK